MTLPQESLEKRLDLRLGQMAVRKGRITPTQLQEALDEQVRGVQRGRKKPRRLGVILAEKKFLTDVEVHALLEEQEALVLAEDRRRREDVFLGRILVDAALVDAEHVRECVELQHRLLEEGAGRGPLLGQLLVQKGYATDAVISQGLELQSKVRFACGACRKEFGVEGLRVDAVDHCPDCDGPLEAVSEEAEPEPEPEPPETEPLPASEELRSLGRYRDLRRIGRGAIGAVYEALDPQLNRKVALKVLRRDLETADGAGSSEVQRFVREAQLAANLPKHPNIVAVYEAGASDGRHFIAMEFIQGRTLSEWRKKGAPLRKQVRALRDVALAVHHGHENGVLHRDLKPGNILIDPEGKPFVVDFGLARPVEASANDPSAKVRICGTPAYMSPEQAAGLTKLDARCDVFALGTILYEILSGRLPFPGRTRDEIFAKLLSDETPPAPVAGTRGRPFSTVDEAVEKVCFKALARDRAQRTPSARAFAADLTRWLDATDPKKTEEAARKGWRRPAILAGAGAALLLVILLVVPLFRKGSSGPERDLRRAVALADAGQTEQALEMYKEILRRDPGNVQAREGRERTHRLLVSEAARGVDEAYSAFERAKTEAQEKANALQRATIADELKLRDESAAAQARVRDAEEKLKKARERLKALADGGDAPTPKSP